ncbi:MAG: ATP-binding protein [Myxococcota bacterium]
MRRSFLRLVVGSVLATWAVGFVVLAAYGRSLSWTDRRAQGDGVFLFYELLSQVPVSSRAERLHELRPHTSIELALISIEEVERRVGRSVRPGDQVPHKVSISEEWYFLAFEDGQGALAAGPVDPGRPNGAWPIGVLLAIIGLPLIAGLVALRVERQLAKVEHASQALAVGEFGVRVDNPRGPSNELAASFNAMAERVERLIRSREELIQAVSHELGSPLSRLRFHVELLGSHSGAEHEERVDAMARELDALDELVAELLSYVRADEVELDRQAFDPKRGLGDLAELAELEAPEGRTVEVELAVPDGIRLIADQRLFQRAVENILRNSMRYARGKVRLELAEEQDHVRVAVHDDGPGIPEPLREKVMAPFVRLEADRDRTMGGVGLGLAIVNRIMHRHGGRLTISDSVLGGAMVATLWPKSS